MMKRMLSGFFFLSSWLLYAQDRPATQAMLPKNQMVLAITKASNTPAGTPADVKAPIRGVVSDEKGSPLPGATVSIKGTQLGTTTDANGRFSLNVPADARVLVISFIGMTTQEVTLGGRTTLNITLKPATVHWMKSW